MPPFLVKFLASKFSGWLAIALLFIVVAWGLYAGIVRPVTKPNPSTTQTGGISNSYNFHPMFGCMSIPVMEEKE